MHKLYTLILVVFTGCYCYAQTDSLLITPVNNPSTIVAKLPSTTSDTITPTLADTTDDMSNIVPAFTIDADILETESSTQDVSGLLQSSKDVYTNTAGFNFGAARFRIRGFGSENYDFLLNGIKVNDPYTNWAVFRYWGGLNDVTRYPEFTNGVGSNQWSFGGVGGTSNVNMRASNIRKTNKISYALSNRSYSHRLMMTYATGMMDNGFAVAFSGSARYAEEGYRPGTNYSAGSYFLSVEKKLNDKHSLGIVGFGAPTIQGKAGISVQEVYDLTGNNYYNPYVGYQTNAETGEKELRNSRRRDTHVPHFLLSHYFTPTKKTTISTTGYLITGKTKNSQLDWFGGNDPRPDYYKYLPSYFVGRNDPEGAAKAQAAWADGTAGSIDYDQLYFVNSKNLSTVHDVGGIAGDSITGLRSNYVITDKVQQDLTYGAKTNVNHIINDKLIYSGGLSYSNYTGKYYLEMNDLMGGDFWVDLNKFSERSFSDPITTQINLDEPNRIIKEGDVYGYNYELHKTNIDLFSQLEFKSAKIDGYVSGNIATTSIWRNGIWKNGIFPENSQGQSVKNNYLTYAAKAGATYKINGRHYINVNGTYQLRPPSLRNSFLQPAWNDDQPTGIKAETVFGGDFNYHIQYTKLRLRATVYSYQVLNQVWNGMFYHDALNSFVNYSMSGVNHSYQGGELGAETQITSTIKAKVVYGMGKYLYKSRPVAYAVSNNTSEPLIPESIIYLENYHVGGTPETVGTFGLEYKSAKFWFIGADINYFADMYLDVNPDRRTEHATSKYTSDDPQLAEMIAQTKLPNGYTINAFAGKSWRINYKYYINLNFNVSNILNVQNFQVGGFEQLRYDVSDINKFANKNSYMYGRTFFAMVGFRF